MYAFVFAIGFAVNVGLALYLVANEKSHAQPWRLFVATMVTLLVAYGFDLGANAINELAAVNSKLRASSDSLGHLAKLSNLICGAFAGALASTAITNRAKLMHDASTRDLLEKLAELNSKKVALHNQLKAELKVGLTDPGDIALQAQKVQAASKILEQLTDNEVAVKSNLQDLGINMQQPVDK